MATRWTTIIEAKTAKGWVFWSQQSILPHETELTDEQYLAVCREISGSEELRIAPTQGYQVCNSALPQPVVWPLPEDSILPPGV